MKGDPASKRSTGDHRASTGTAGERGAVGILGILAVFAASAIVITLVMLFVTGLAQRQLLPRMRIRAEQALPEKPVSEADALLAPAGVTGAPPSVGEPAAPKWSPGALDSLKALKQQIRIGQEGLDARLEEVRRMTEQLQKERATADEAADARMAEMAKVYSNMKPQAAAQVMAYLDDKTFKQVFDQLNKRQAAKILAFINPARVARLTKQASVSAAGARS